MGQQQLLITVLVTIIVGIAVIIAINTMEDARINANESAIRQDILMVLNDAEMYYQKPEALGGGGNSFEGISEEHILSIDPTNENGTYSISGSDNSVTVEAEGNHPGVELSATATITSSGRELNWSEPDEE